MKLLIMHLSDLHITGIEDPILDRMTAIVDAVKNIERGLSGAFMVISGDVTQCGSDDQYFAAEAFLDDLRNSLSEKLTTSITGKACEVHRIAVPGNHDCDLSASNHEREKIAKSVIEKPELIRDAQTVQICTDVQKSFFTFLDRIESKPREFISSEFHKQLYYEYSFKFGDETIRFLCCNSAWLSRLNEQQGSLYFPAEAIGGTPQDVLDIAVMHHPFNWLEAECANRLAKRIREVASFVLTGHEHDADRYTSTGIHGEVNEYLEGGLLQDKFGSLSTFNILVVDTVELKQKVMRLSWDNQFYVPFDTSHRLNGTSENAWRDYSMSHIRRQSQFLLNKDFVRTCLDDPGVTLAQQHIENVTLPDVFVWPDLRQVADLPNERSTLIKGDHFHETLSSKRHMLIVGDNSAGKSSLAKMTFRHLHEDGAVPILLSGEERFPNEDKLRDHLENAFCVQYDPTALEAYRQLDLDRIVIIIDDYHKMPIKRRAKRKLVTALSRYAGRIILLAHEFQLAVHDLTRPETVAEGGIRFDCYRVQPFGALAINKLVEKWLKLGVEGDPDAPDFTHRHAEIMRILEILIGRNYVPSYPIYILSVLQANEATTPIDTRASAHGYFYELFIRAAIATGGSSEQYDITAAYLAHLAYQMFSDRVHQIPVQRLQQIHVEYERIYAIRIPFEQKINALLTKNILIDVCRQIRFKYRYTYFYFVASYLRDHIDSPEIKKSIAMMAKSLHIDEYANILLFLAHLSKDPFIVEEMLSAAEVLYSDSPRARLEDEVEFLNRLMARDTKLVLEERPPSEVRRDMDNAKDDGNNCSDSGTALNEPVDIPGEDAFDPTDPLTRLNAALKTLQILGQILRNFPGSIAAERKVKIADTCFGLGLRTLSGIISLVRDSEIELLNEFAKIIHEHHPAFLPLTIRERACQTVIALAEVIAFGMTRQISRSLGSPELFLTYESLKSTEDPASVDLIHASLEIDYRPAFPTRSIVNLSRRLKEKYLARSVLRNMVGQHFLLHGIDFRIRQQVCEELQIEFKKVVGPSASQKMLGPP